MSFCYVNSNGFLGLGGKLTNESWVNAMYYNQLPLMYTNFGGDMQISVMDMCNPYINQTIFNPIAMQQMGVPPFSCFLGAAGGSAETPEAPDVSSAVDQAHNNVASSNIKAQMETLKCMKTRLNATINKEGIKDEDKTKLEGFVSQIDALNTELETLKNSTGENPEDVVNKTKESQKKIKDLSKEIADAIKKAEENIQQSSTENTNNENNNNNNDNNNNNNNNDNNNNNN